MNYKQGDFMGFFDFVLDLKPWMLGLISFLGIALVFVSVIPNIVFDKIMITLPLLAITSFVVFGTGQRLSQKIIDYSKSELEGVSLDKDLVLFTVNTKKSVPLGKATLREVVSYEKLGSISCPGLTYRECILEVKKNKDQIVQQLNSENKEIIVSRE